MKLSDICVLLRVTPELITVLFIGSYEQCVEKKIQDSIYEIIVKKDDTINVNLLK